MNVIKIMKNPRKKVRSEEMNALFQAAQQRRLSDEWQWQAVLEALLFGLMTIVSVWPLLAAADAVIRYL